MPDATYVEYCPETARDFRRVTTPRDTSDTRPFSNSLSLSLSLDRRGSCVGVFVHALLRRVQLADDAEAAAALARDGRRHAIVAVFDELLSDDLDQLDLPPPNRREVRARPVQRLRSRSRGHHGQRSLGARRDTQTCVDHVLSLNLWENLSGLSARHFF